MEILQYPHSDLRKVCRSVTRDNFKKVNRLIPEMIKLTRDNNGIGLAAPQVGVDLRLFICKQEDGYFKTFINPQIIDVSSPIISEEGCLSVPGIIKSVNRFDKCLIKAYDLYMREFKDEEEGLLARCWQHEMDHLSGVLIIDY